MLSFLLGCYLIFDLVTIGFNWMVLIGVFVSFILSNYLWPKDRKDKDSLENSWEFIDWIEFIITLPFRAIAMFLRAVGRVGKEADSFDL